MLSNEEEARVKHASIGYGVSSAIQERTKMHKT